MTILATTVPTPRPGDGVCPTTSQFDDVVRVSYKHWSFLALEAGNHSCSLYITERLLDLLQQIPAFRAPPSTPFFILDDPYPQVKYALEWVTTTDPTCDQPTKRTYHFQTLGIPEPAIYELLNACPCWPGIEAGQSKYFSNLIFAWTYILSSRWVEILKDMGEKAYLHQSEETDCKNFWDIAGGQRWQATMVRGGNAFHAPWSLIEEGTATRFQPLESPPNSSLAFNSLVGFCRSEGIAKECISAALSVVLMLPEHDTNTLKLPPLIKPKHLDATRGFRDIYYDKLFGCLNSCITLSCNPEGIYSLLCSGFFDPKVPCNLVGAYLLGINDALEPVKNDPKTLAHLMVRQSPKISPLWLAAIWSGRASKILASATGGLPPISFPVASWTGTQQSFIQIGYPSVGDQADTIPRACEYSVIYFVKPDAGIPFTPSPPFGEAPIWNISLEVNAHLRHDHKPLESRTYWILENGEQLPAQEEFMQMPCHNARLLTIDRSSPNKGHESNEEENAVNSVSCDATFNLFSWYRNNEGGLWLVEGHEDVDYIRTIQSHPWITYDSDEEAFSESEEFEKEIDEKRINSWRAGVEDAEWSEDRVFEALCILNV